MVIQKLQEKLFILKGRTIGLLGLAFKPDTDDLRDAPSLHIAERLLQMGARVKAYDPIANAACREQRPDLKIRSATPRWNSPASPTRWCWSRSGASSTTSIWPDWRGDDDPDSGGRPQLLHAGDRDRRGLRLYRRGPRLAHPVATGRNRIKVPVPRGRRQSTSELVITPRLVLDLSLKGW